MADSEDAAAPGEAPASPASTEGGPPEAAPLEASGEAVTEEAHLQKVSGLASTPELKTAAEWPWKPLEKAPEGEAAASPTGGQSPKVASLAVAAAGGEAAGEGEGAADLSFVEDMWDRFDVIWQNRIEPSHRLLEQVTDAMSKRAELERKYGESLNSFAGEVVTDSQANSVHAAVESVMVNFKNRAEQSIELADSIEQDIVAAFEVVIQQHRACARHIYNDLQLLVRYMQERRRVHDKCARRYASRCIEAEMASQECLQGLAMKTVERMRLAIQATQLSKQARLAEHEYYAAISQANHAQSLYEAHLPRILSALQDMEDKRGKCVTDGLMKLAVFETSWLRNMQYDLEATVKAGESADVGLDLQAFIREHKTPPPEGRGVPLAARGFWSVPRKEKDLPKALGLPKVVLDVQQYIRQLIDTELSGIFAKLLAQDAPADAADQCKEQLEQLKANLADPRLRAALCQVLRTEVLKREAQPTELDNAAGLSVAPACLDALVQLFKASLDACDEQHDSWCGRDFMVLAQKFRAEVQEAGKTVSLLSRVYNHALWNKVTFWEETLLLGLCEAHAAEAVWRRSVPPGSQFTQPAMTAFLQHFVGYMMAFGISFDQGRNSVASTLKKHSLLLGSAVKPYAALLLQAYEAAPVGGAGAPSAMAPREMEPSVEDAKPTLSPTSGGGDGGGAAAAAEDDFEAMAFGLPPGDSSTAASTGAVSSKDGDDSGEDAEAPGDQVVGEAGSPGADALRVLGGSQPSVDDVFG